jgi:hypothetical protein
MNIVKATFYGSTFCPLHLFDLTAECSSLWFVHSARPVCRTDMWRLKMFLSHFRPLDHPQLVRHSFSIRYCSASAACRAQIASGYSSRCVASSPPANVAATLTSAARTPILLLLLLHLRKPAVPFSSIRAGDAVVGLPFPATRPCFFIAVAADPRRTLMPSRSLVHSRTAACRRSRQRRSLSWSNRRQLIRNSCRVISRDQQPSISFVIRRPMTHQFGPSS